MRQKIVSSYYQIAPLVTVCLTSDHALIHFLVHQFLFPIRLKTCRRPNGHIKIFAEKHQGFVLRAHGRAFRASDLVSLLPLIDMEARWIIARHLPSAWFPIHAAAVQKKNRSILLLGESGAGKSRTLIRLVRKGFTGLSDELNFLNLKTLTLASYLRHWNLKSPLDRRLKRLSHVTFLTKRPKRNQKIINHYFPVTEFQKTSQRIGPEAICLYYLKNNHARHSQKRALTTAEIIKHLVDNSYIYTLRHHQKPRLAQRYQSRFLNIFKRLAQSPKAFLGYELTVKSTGKFSQLIC